MQKAILGILLAIILMITSCTKNSSNNGGSWTFKSATFNTIISQTGSNYLSAIGSSNGTGNNPSLTVYFYNALPAVGGHYAVVSGRSPGSASQIGIEVNDPVGSLYKEYDSTGGNGAETVTVTVSGGKVAVSGSGIMLLNTQDPTDSSAVSFNISQ